jgi:hypothetical protein
MNIVRSIEEKPPLLKMFTNLSGYLEESLPYTQGEGAETVWKISHLMGFHGHSIMNGDLVLGYIPLKISLGSFDRVMVKSFNSSFTL